MNYELIEVNACPICGRSQYKVVFKKGKFSGQQCKECGLIYLNPRLKNPNNVYIDDQTSSTSKYYESSIKADRKTFTERIKIIEEFAAKGFFLDIGCSTGTFLEIARENGWNVHGVEPNPKSALICKEKGLPVINDFFGNKTTGNRNKFDAVYFGDVIEHLPNPEKDLLNIYNILKKDGIVMIVTPNFDSLSARFLQIKPLEHILYFNKSSIAYLLKKTNFKIERITTTTRERAIKAMAYSTTFKSSAGKLFVKIIALLHLDKPINLLLKLFVRDEILAVARKK